MSFENGFQNNQKRGFGLAGSKAKNAPVNSENDVSPPNYSALSNIINANKRINNEDNYSKRAKKPNKNNTNEEDDNEEDDDMTEQYIDLGFTRKPGIGLGISIAGGVGSTPYRDGDEVRLRVDECTKPC